VLAAYNAGEPAGLGTAARRYRCVKRIISLSADARNDDMP
jgi:hypothetical protein